MGITIGITGHTKGFGKHISARCKELGYKVEGFSRTNGYDIRSNPENVFNKKLDAVVNNAEVGDAQIHISVLANLNKIPCINIGSDITEANITNEEYKTYHRLAYLVNIQFSWCSNPFDHDILE